MIVQTVIATDLITPLGAYLRLRETGTAAFLLESVEKGRLGRHSFVGAGSRFNNPHATGNTEITMIAIVTMPKLFLMSGTLPNK